MPTVQRLASVGAVIVHFHREPDAARLVDDLVERHGIINTNVVLVDNGSAAGRLSAELSSREKEPATIAQGNLGYAGGMNVGIRHLPTQVDTLLLLTHEVKLGKGCVAALIDSLDSDTGVGVAGPLLVTSDGLIWSAGGRLTPLRRLPTHGLHGAHRTSAPRTALDCDWLDGAVLALRRSVWEQVGGLDERYFLYAEDVDLGLRVRASGQRVILVPQATAIQEPSGAIPPFLWTRNPFLLFRAHGMWLAWVFWLASALVGVARDMLMRPRRAYLRQRITAIRAGLTNRGGPPAASSTRPAP